VPQRKFGFEEITKLSLKSWLFADIGGEVTHCNAAFLKPPSVSRLVAWQIDPGHLTSFLEERGSWVWPIPINYRSLLHLQPLQLYNCFRLVSHAAAQYIDW